MSGAAGPAAGATAAGAAAGGADLTQIALFADPRGEHWAILIRGAAPRLALAPLGSPSGDDAETRPHAGTAAAVPEITFSEVTIDEQDAGSWSVAGHELDLRFELGDADGATHADTNALIPCRLTGTWRSANGATELDLPGVLVQRLPAGKVGSLRVFGSWFADGHAVSLIGVRPKGAKGHDDDNLDVITLGEQHKLIFDPRLSTTYGPDGGVRRAGIELWLGDDEDGDQYPRRISGLASGSATSDVAGQFTLHAQALRCVSGGESGAGVYLLASA